MITGKKVGFLGGGNMGEALIKGLLVSGRLDASQVQVSDISRDRLQHLKSNYQVLTVETNSELTGTADIVVIAVKPQQMGDVLTEISGNLEHSPLIFSIAAGVPLAYLQQQLAKPVPIVRVMPNTPALVLAGISAISAGAYATADHMNLARVLFEAVGRVVEVDESHMDAVTGLSGSGPAYIFLVIEALIDAGVKQGLTRPVARDLAVQTTLGSAKLLADSHAHPATLKDQITSPGGTTVQGLAVLERKGLRGALMDAVAAATQRSKELGKKVG
jgi:pyrroline-5-carboxylate reductase